jgi:hypothetical protein
MVAPIVLPELKIVEKPGILNSWIPEDFSMTCYPFIFLAKTVNGTRPEWLLEHEKYHAKRQKDLGVCKWVWKYETDKSFQFDEECRGYAFGFCFLDPTENVETWIAWAAGLLNGSGYHSAASSKEDAVNKIRMYYNWFQGGNS